MEKCNCCGMELEQCICPQVAKFFEENRHLMTTETGERREQTKKKFVYHKGLSPLAKSH